LKERNAIDAKIAALIGRPVERGHLGEYIGGAVFNINLAPTATNSGSDGVFQSGPLTGRSVNVKFYGKREGCLDLVAHGGPDYYLVLTGAKAAAASSRGATRPLVIEAVYLFEGAALLSALSKRTPPPKIGIATSVANEYWDAAEIWPRTVSAALKLTDRQRQTLLQFGTSLAS
jgi:hypothetical protein